MTTHTVRAGLAAAASVVLLSGVAVAPAAAQSDRPAPVVLGERYHVEVSGTIWNPSLFGAIASSRLNAIGSNLDFASDLGFAQTRFKELRFVLRPAPKHRFRFQYTPIQYTADTIFERDVTFRGEVFPVSVPVTSTFGWKVWRMGYEYDFLYKPRGFLGVLFETRYTEMTASIGSPFTETASVLASAPLPSLGVVGRVYVVPEVAVNFEISGLKIPRFNGYEGDYLEWDLGGTFNVTNNVGLQVGWRKVTTFLVINQETGDLKFQGLWFGAAVRY